MNWTQSEAITLIKSIEAMCPQFGVHVALTGGCLYKEGERKDLDLLFYRIRQVEEVDFVGLAAKLQGLGFATILDFDGSWLTKARYMGKSVDIFFPEASTGIDYHPEVL